MSVVPRDEWFWTLVEAVERQQAAITDRIGRPWAQHFEGGALRCLFRNPRASRAQLEAALLHDTFMDRGGGHAMLAELRVSDEAIDIIQITTPPPDADFYRDFEAIGPAECNLYLAYARTLAASGQRAAMVLILATERIGAQPAMAADPIAVELTQETQHLVDIIREGDEEAGPTGPPIMVSSNCNYRRQWWYERCGPEEALVSFTTSGPGSVVWNYVALFRILPKETDMSAEIRREYHRKPKHVALVTFAFVPEPLGLIGQLYTCVTLEANYLILAPDRRKSIAVI